ncbi:hypothetical protein DPMN_129300, partial [Dreissena polymorpha]
MNESNETLRDFKVDRLAPDQTRYDCADWCEAALVDVTAALTGVKLLSCSDRRYGCADWCEAALIDVTAAPTGVKMLWYILRITRRLVWFKQASE